MCSGQFKPDRYAGPFGEYVSYRRVEIWERIVKSTEMSDVRFYANFFATSRTMHDHIVVAVLGDSVVLISIDDVGNEFLNNLLVFGYGHTSFDENSLNICFFRLICHRFDIGRYESYNFPNRYEILFQIGYTGCGQNEVTHESVRYIFARYSYPAMARYAVLLNAGPTAVGPPVNAIQYALQLDGHGHEVRVFFDGAATKWPEKLASMADHPLREYYNEAQERSVIEGACGFCAHTYGTVQYCHEAGIQLYGDADNHGPDVGQLASDGYQLLTIG